MTRDTTLAPRAIGTGALLALLLVSLLVLPGSAQAAFPGTNGKIAFATTRDGNNEIYTMNADGSGQTRITTNGANDFDPAWSPDGTKIAFTTDRDAAVAPNYEIYTMNADGSGQARITNNPASDGEPAWSPDGTKIAFSTFRDEGYEVYTMNADGSGQTNVTNNAEVDFGPAWSPDGTKIAFTTLRDGISDVYTMNADGSGQARITNNPASDGEPAWSPDGTKIAFSSFRDGNVEIYTMNADGTGQTNVTNNPGFDADPAWSPDGTKIAFAISTDGNYDVYTMNADGSGQTNVTNNPAFDAEPDWEPLAPVTPPLDHFKTYEIGDGKPRFSKRTVTLTDAFGTSHVSVNEPVWLANPVDKTSEGINSPDDHLKCYSISDKKKFKEQKLTIDNQFGAGQKLDVESPKRLCVPASKGLANQTPADPPTDLDHYKCYEAESKTLNRTVTLTDQFVTGDQVRVLEPEYFCNPADKNNEGITRPHDLLVCYELSRVDRFSKRKVSLRDQFTTQTVEVKSPKRLCVPSARPTTTPAPSPRQ